MNKKVVAIPHAAAARHMLDVTELQVILSLNFSSSFFWTISKSGKDLMPLLPCLLHTDTSKNKQTNKPFCYFLFISLVIKIYEDEKKACKFFFLFG